MILCVVCSLHAYVDRGMRQALVMKRSTLHGKLRPASLAASPSAQKTRLFRFSGEQPVTAWSGESKAGPGCI